MSKYKVALSTFDGLISGDTTFTISGTIDEDTITVLTSLSFAYYVDYFYSERSILVPSTIDEDNTAAQFAYFASLFSKFKSIYGDDIIRAYYARTLEYNPLDNYNGYEKIETTHGKTETTTRGTTDTRTLNLSDSLTNGSTVTTSTDVYGVNSATAVPSDITTAAHTGSDSTTHTGTDTLVRTGSDTVADTGTDTVETEKSGNLGVTTSQQMLNAETDLRMQPFVFRVVNLFMKLHTVY